MLHRQKAWAIVVATFLVAICGTAHVANAARFLPAPLLSQFERGFGIVAAQVADAKAVTSEKNYPRIYDCSFTVHEVVAQPINGKEFALHSGDTLKLQLTAGYACQIEWNVKSVLDNGKCYYLIVRRNDDGTFEHCGGASALMGVEKFETSEDQFYARVRALAGEPKDGRLTALVKVVKSPTESDRLRSVALSGIETELWPKASAAGAADARISLRKIWNDPQSHLSIGLLHQLDYVLGIADRDFDDSAERRDVWLANLLTLTPERKKDDDRIDSIAESVLRDLANRQPDAVGQRLAVELPNKEWPIFYRRAMARGLLNEYQLAERADPKWELALQTYFIDVMAGEPYPIRVAAADLEVFSGAKGSDDSTIRRWYVPDAKVKTALKGAMARLDAASRVPGAEMEEDETAADELARVIRVLDNLPAPTTPPQEAPK